MAAKTTPVMKQHAAAKAEYPDCVVFFRLGDFYEMFGEDAVTVARELELTLTSRNKGKPDEIPMAGVPHHSAHGYIGRLLSKGYKVAICEQMADPATIKGIVPRQVVRVLTPGTWVDEANLDTRQNNWLCAIEQVDGEIGIALFDATTAELLAASVGDLSTALSEIVRAAPTEVLVSPSLETADATDGSLTAALFQVVPRAQVRVDVVLSQAELGRAVSGVDWENTAPAAVAAAGRALAFAKKCYCDDDFMVWRVAQLNPLGVVQLDRTAVTHLELVQSSVGDPQATLLSVLDRTRSPGGSRVLRRRLLAPLLDVAQIRRRQDSVETLVNNPKVRTQLQDHLKSLGDLERLAVRGAERKASPKDLGNVRKGLRAASAIFAVLEDLPDAESRRTLGLDAAPDLAPDLLRLLEASLVERPPAQSKEGAIFVSGYDEELDELSELRTSGTSRLTALEEELKRETQISNLRVKFTRVFGWYVEVGRAHVSRVPDTFRRKQTVASGERYTLPRLDDLAEEIEQADARYRERELTLLSELVESLAGASKRVHELTAFLSSLDIAAALAEVATDLDYCRPTVDQSEHIEIVDGRHPVVERLAAEGRFVPNDTNLVQGESHLFLISGPNMAGKSTYLRQVALIVILAQIGSFVPAKSARVGLVDRVLSRVGASDNLAGGESTFMVEMRETANILASATSRSLVILDEVGRGTSTFDGLAIAWAVAEHLDQVVRCRSLFATHYHELTALGQRSSSCQNYCVSAKEHEGEVIFLHRVNKGAASRSYGVAVAQLAGLPETVLSRARALLSSFESGDTASLVEMTPKAALSRPNPQLDLFASRKDAAEELALDRLRSLNPNKLTGLDALQLIHQLHASLVPESGSTPGSDES